MSVVGEALGRLASVVAGRAVALRGLVMMEEEGLGKMDAVGSRDRLDRANEKEDDRAMVKLRAVRKE